MTKAGTIYGIKVTWDDDPGVYYFGKTASRFIWNECEQYAATGTGQLNQNINMCESLRRCGRVGLHSAKEVILWRHSLDVEDDFRVFYNRLIDKDWVLHETELGRNWVSSSLDSETMQAFVGHLYHITLGDDEPLAPSLLLMHHRDDGS